MRNRNNIQRQKVLKDYAVPLVGICLILFLVGSYFFGGSTTDSATSDTENQVGLSIVLDSPETEAYITYPGDDYKKKIEETMSMYKGEKIQIKSGTVSINGQGIGEFKLGKLGELKYEEDGSISLYSADLWIKNSFPITVNMRYAKVNVGENSVLNVTQNEVGSTVYNISGFVEVANLAGKNTVLGKMQKVTVSRTDAAKTDADISLLKDDIDDYFKSSDWFLKNNGESYLVSTTQDGTGTGATSTGKTSTGSMESPITLINLQDEQTVKETNINVSGKVNDDKVAFVSLGTVKVPVRETDKGFEIRGLQLTSKVNDLVLKSYDGSGNLIAKYPYTIYLEGAIQAGPKDLFEVKNFSLDASKFKFLNPKENPLTTTERILTIEGTVPENIVDKIDVNGFVLTKFPSGGTYWKYHVNADYGNLKDGLNVYEVKYIGKDGTLLHKNAFTIVKKGEEKAVSPEANTASGSSN